jgi:hypothetical protein
MIHDGLNREAELGAPFMVQSRPDGVLQPKVAPICRGCLGCTFGNGNNASGVVAGILGARERNGRNRVAVGGIGKRRLRVVRSSQPWAVSRNPFGILGKRNDPTRSNHGPVRDEGVFGNDDDAVADVTEFMLDHPGGKIIGLVTLHDLLRAEVEKGKSGDI